MASFSKPSGGFLPMLFALFVFLQITVALGHGHGHRSPQEMKRHFEMTKRQLEERQVQTSWLWGNYLTIQGVNPGSPAPRLEIRELKKNADMWNLYILGMEKFMGKSKNDKVGFYQIAGVHGRPYTTWNNFPSPLVNVAGFCPHSETLFASWHRPYLALYEQAWHLCVQEVINEFPTSQQGRLRDVARNLRMPYFDWAQDPGAGQPAVPATMRDQYVTVTKPQGTVSIPNPLYSYTWGSSLPSEMGGGPWDNFATTLRRPVSNPTRSNNNEMNARFATIRISLRDRIYNLFAARPVPSFGSVATSRIGARGANNAVDSLEGIHDAAHNTAGGESGGHMYYLDYSAFDPFFWLHHTNVDRLMAMYQATTPNTNIADAAISRPMAQWNRGEPKNPYTPLKPFTKNSKGDYFTSMDAKWTTPFGYYYPETVNNNAQDVYNAVQRLYGPGFGSLRTRDESTETDMPQYPGRPFEEGEENYVLNIIANRYAIEGSYSIHCFIGNPSNSTNGTAPYPVANGTASAAPAYPTASGSVSIPYGNSTSSEGEYNPADDFTLDPNYVGNYGVMGMMMADNENPMITSGVLPLTSCLQGKHAAGLLSSLTRKHVESYLKEHLSCKVIGTGNVEIPADKIPNLHMGVKACPVKPAKNPGEMPEMGDYEDVLGVTEHMPAGKPYTHVLTPIEKVYDSPPTEGYPFPSKPDQEDGYCVSKQTIKYVDPEGNFLYEEMS